MINHKEYLFKSLDGKGLFLQSWSNGQTPQGLICLVHNVGDHSGKFDAWAKLFVMSGFAVTALDLRGNGRSQGKRGHAKSYDDLANDMHLFVKRSRKMYQHIPIFIYGHGLGGTLAMYYMIKKNPKIQGLITTSPWLEMFKLPGKVKGSLGKFMKLTLPRHSIVYKPSEDKNEHNIDNNDQLKDLLTHNKISVKLFIETIETGKWILKNLFKVHHPLLMIYGKEDKLTSYKSCKRYVHNTGEFTKLIVLRDCSHDIYRCEDFMKINKEIVHWIRENSIIANTNVAKNELIPN